MQHLKSHSIQTSQRPAVQTHPLQQSQEAQSSSVSHSGVGVTPPFPAASLPTSPPLPASPPPVPGSTQQPASLPCRLPPLPRSPPLPGRRRRRPAARRGTVAAGPRRRRDRCRRSRRRRRRRRLRCRGRRCCPRRWRRRRGPHHCLRHRRQQHRRLVPGRLPCSHRRRRGPRGRSAELAKHDVVAFAWSSVPPWARPRSYRLWTRSAGASSREGSHPVRGLPRTMDSRPSGWSGSTHRARSRLLPRFPTRPSPGRMAELSVRDERPRARIAGESVAGRIDRAAPGCPETGKAFY